MFLSICQSLILFVSKLFKWEFGFCLQHWLNSFFSFLYVLGSKSSTWGSDLSDFIGFRIVRLSSLISDSVGHCFIIYIFLVCIKKYIFYNLLKVFFLFYLQLFWLYLLELELRLRFFQSLVHIWQVLLWLTGLLVQDSWSQFHLLLWALYGQC